MLLMMVTRAGRGICTRGDGFEEQEAAGAGRDRCAMGRKQPFLGGEPVCGSLVVGGTEGWEAKNEEPCSSRAAQLCEPKPCSHEPSAWLMQLQPGRACWVLSTESDSVTKWGRVAATPHGSSASTISPSQSLCHSSPLLSLSRSLPHPYGKDTSTLLQQQHKAEGKGESKALAHSSQLGSAGAWAGKAEGHSGFPVRLWPWLGTGNMQQEAGCRCPAFLCAGNPSHASCSLLGQPPPQAAPATGLDAIVDSTCMF